MGISTIAGTDSGGYNGDGGAATSAKLYHPYGIAVDAELNMYIADYYNHRIRFINASTGIISTIAGTGSNGYNGDGGAATSAKLRYPIGVAVDTEGSFYISDMHNLCIRRVVASTGIINTVSGSATNAAHTGDGDVATSAMLNYPYGITVD